MKIDRTALNRKFHALLNELDMMPYKLDVLSPYGVESSRDLSDDQLAEVCNSLQAEKQRRGDCKLKSARSTALRLLTDIGVYYIVPGEGKYECWSRVNAFLRSPKIAGNELYKLSITEIEQLVMKLRGMKHAGYYYRRSEIDAAPSAAESQAPGTRKTEVLIITDKGIGGPVN